VTKQEEEKAEQQEEEEKEEENTKTEKSKSEPMIHPAALLASRFNCQWRFRSYRVFVI
jgi:hypothetical protein